jgi:hypothetical protein
MSVLGNYVKLVPEVWKWQHWTDHQIVEKTITDPVLKRTKTVRTLTFWVDREDGAKVDKTYSVTAEKLAVLLSPYLPDKGYRNYEMGIRMRGAGFQTTYELETRPIR